MREFGWTIEYTLALTFPMFLELFDLISRVRADAAVDVVFSGYSAAKYGGKLRKHLFERRGSFYLGTECPGMPPRCTKRQEKLATKKLQEIIEARDRALAERVGRC